MKLSSLLWSLFGIMALSACSENEMSEENDLEVKNGGRFLAVEIANPATTRAESVLDGDYEAGLDGENKVNSLRFYFFDGTGAPVSVNVVGDKNYVDCTEIISEGQNDMPNVEKKLQAIVVINTKDGNNANVSSMVAVANHETVELGEGALSLTEICKKIGDYSSVEKEENNGSKIPHFLMTSSSYAGTDGQITVATINPVNLCKSEEDAKNNPVNIYIERVVAKTKLNAEWNTEKVTIKENVTYQGKTYTAVALKDHKGNDIKVDEKQIYVIFTAWDITGTVDKSYLFKKVNSVTAWNLGWIWNNSDFFRSFWAMNPEDVKLGYISYNDIDCEVGENGVAYCLENAADDFNNGTKSAYNPDVQVCNRTQAIIAAVLVTVDGSQASPIDLAKWAGRDYTEESVKVAMLNTMTNQIYIKETGGGDEKFVSIKPEHVLLVTGTNAGEADDKSENSARYLSYLQLTEEAKTLDFYSSTSEDARLTVDAVNTILKSIPGAKVWKTGMTYYYTDLRHLGTEATKGLYGVVRNHIYDVNVQSVVGLGTPVYNPDEVIVPQKPGEDETYIAAKINILSWRIVNNDVDLVW